jgi:hypothetical protein
MALPIYESGNIKLTDAPSLQYVDIQQQEKTNQRIGQFLQFASEVTGSLATDYAQEQAIKYTIANPITKDRIDASIASGTDPLQGILTGGMDYNAALKKATAQQTAGVLENELHAHFSDVIARVDRNELTNREEILNELQAPIQGQIKFFSQIDPEIASAYGNQATNIATNKYQTALALLNKKAEEKSLIESEQYGINASKDFDEFLRNNPGASAAAIKEYINASETVAMQNSYKFSTNPNKLLELHKNRLKIVKDNYLSEQIAKEFQGKDILEVVDGLRNNKSIYSKHYKEMDPVEQIDFETLLKTDLNLYKADNAARDKIARRQLDLIRQSYLDQGQRIPPDIIKTMYGLVEPGSDFMGEIDLMVKESIETEQLNKSNLPDLVSELNDLTNRRIDPDQDLSIPETQRLNRLEPYVKNMYVALKNDPVGLMGKRDGNFEELDLNDPDLENKVLARKSLVERNASKYGINDLDKDMMIFTKSEVNAFVNTYMRSDGQTRVAMLQVLDEKFGADNSAALVQLVNGGLPTTAELSSYFNNPTLTERFLSFDEKDERDRLKVVAQDLGTTYREIRTEIANQLADFRNVVMLQNPFNKSIATQKMDNINDALTYLAISEMQTGQSVSNAITKATKDLKESFQIKDTYYVPSIYNGNPIDPDEIIAKAERIKDIHLADFNAVPFGSFMGIVDEKERNLEFRTQMVENGKWQNTADGTGLIYGITMSDGSFGPIQDVNGNFLTFKFDDAKMVVPFTNIDITVPEGETVLELIGRKERAKMSDEEYEKRYGRKRGTR